MAKTFIITGSLLSGLAVAVGAFGAHALKTILASTGRLETFETGVKYHFYHALGLILVGLLMTRFEHKFLAYSGYSFVLGIILFSGSLYLLSTLNMPKLGMITPLGGIAFILGWIFMALGTAKGLN